MAGHVASADGVLRTAKASRNGAVTRKSGSRNMRPISSAPACLLGELSNTRSASWSSG